MCKIQVSVTVSNPVDQKRAKGKLDGFPNVLSVDEKPGSVVAIVEHPNDFTNLQAAAWAKDTFGMDPSLAPSVTILAQ